MDKQSDDINQLDNIISIKNTRLEHDMETLKEQIKTNLEAASSSYDKNRKYVPEYIFRNERKEL
ncbi:hypothetical protein GF319_11540 [Candidatus Bathyarchaeota archaeon]|nr:hypothetical protein [Candidatus Bathyarchaeota archaeon]